MSEQFNEIFGGVSSGGSGGTILQWDPVLEPNKIISGQRGGGTYVIINNSTITNIDNVPAGTAKNTIIFFNNDIKKWDICSASDSQQVYKGTFATPAILQSTYPAANQNIGSTADVLSTATKWFVNTSSVWVDSGSGEDLSSLKIANFLSEFNTPIAKSTAAQNIDVYQKSATNTLLDTKITKITNPVANQIPLMDADGNLFKSNKLLGDFEPVITTKNSAFNKNYGTDANKLKQNGVAAVGTEDSVARLDHVHPSDTAKADLTYVNTQLASKANTTDVNTQLALKADLTYVNTQLSLKANTTDVNTQLSLKANTTDVNTSLNLKLDKTSVVNTLISTSTTDVLSANQGKVLQDTKLDKASVKDTLTSTSTTDALATSAGKQLKDLIDTKVNSSELATLAQQAVINNGVANTTQTYSSSTIEERLANLPQGGGSGTSYYLGNIASDISTYNVLETSPFATTGTFTATANNNQVLLKSFATAVLNRTIVNSGFWEFNFSCSINTSPTSGKVSNLFIELYTRDGSTETLLSSVTTESITSLSKIEVNAVLTQQQLNITSTTRLVVKVYAKTTEVSNILFTLFYGGTDSHIHAPFKITKADIGLSNVENVDTTKASNITVDGTFTPINSAIVSNDTIKVGLQKTQGQIDNFSNTKQNNISVTDSSTIDLTFSNSNLEAIVKDSSIDATKLANNAVTTSKILDNNVTDQKISTGVSSAKIQQTTFADNTNALANGDTLDVALNKIQYQAKDAIHKNTSNEINNLTNKATLIGTDIVLGENSANLFSKIKLPISSIASYILSEDKNVKNWYLSGGSNGTGLDINSGYSPNNALNTLATAITRLGNTGESLIWLPSQLTESGNFSQLNIDVKGDNGAMGAMAGTTGTITSSNSSSSQRYTNLTLGNFTKTGAGSVYLKSINISGNLTDSSAGYFDINGATLANISITGTGIKSFFDTLINGTITINNSQATVSIQSNERGITLATTNAMTLTAGTLSIKNAVIFCPSNTIFGTSGFNLLLDNVKFIDPNTGLSQTINIPSGVNYSLQNCEYAANSTINGVDISSTRIKRFANVFAKIADIASATIQTLNVKDKTILLNSSGTTDAGADAGGLVVKGATNKSILFTNTQGVNPSNFSSSENINVASGKNYYINNVLYAEATKTFKNTTINISDSNTISGITDTSIATNAGISANKLGNGNVDNTKLGYLANLTSDVQTQLNDKQTSSATLTTLASTANPSTLVKFGATALTPADIGKYPQVNASGNIDYVTLSPSSGGGFDSEYIGAIKIWKFPVSTVPNTFIILDGRTYLKADWSEGWAWAIANNLVTNNESVYNANKTLFYEVNSTSFRPPADGGYYYRGLDTSGLVDPNGVNKTVGSVYNYLTALPTTPFTTNTTGAHTHGVQGQDIGDLGSGTFAVGSGSGTQSGSAGAHSHTITAGGDNETSPKHIAVLYIMKFKTRVALQSELVAGTNVTINTQQSGETLQHIISANLPSINYATPSDIIQPNLLINPCFEVNQRGTSFTGISTSQYTSDQCIVNRSNLGTVDFTVFPLTSSDIASVGVGANYARVVQTNASASNVRLEWKIPNVRASSGKTVTLSFWARATASAAAAPTELVVDFVQNLGTGGSGTGFVVGERQIGNQVITGAGSMTSAWQKFTISETFNTIDEGTVTFGTTGTDCFYFRIKNRQTQAWEYDITNIKFEFGSLATPFIKPNSALTLTSCLEFFERLRQVETTPLCNASYQTTTNAQGVLRYNKKRTANPSITPSGTTALIFTRSNATVTSTAASALAGNRQEAMILSGTFTSGTVNDAGYFTLNTGAFIDISSEL